MHSGRIHTFTCPLAARVVGATHLTSQPVSSIFSLFSTVVPAGSPSRGGNVKVCELDINQPSLHTLFFYSVLVSLSVFIAISVVFHSINSSDNSSLSHSVLPVSYLPYWSFQLYISFMKISFSLCG